MDQNESLTLTAEAELTKDQAMPDSDEKMEENHPLTADDENHKDKAMSDSDDSDSEDEAQQNLLLESLQTELAANPSNYDGHLQYIKLLRRTGDVDKLIRAREAMSELFPLSPEMWHQWIKDELSLSTASRPEAFSRILKLYERGVFDYLSISLWCDYINFVQEFDPMVRQCTPTGISKARDLFESALTAAGLHVAEGSKIWEAYRQYEQAILLTTDDTDAQAKEKQVQRIRSLFHRQLSVPLADMSSTLTAYKAWEAEQRNLQDVETIDLVDIYPHVASSYQKALEMYNARFHLEEQILSLNVSDSEKLQHYMNYLKFEQSYGMPARIQVLYERAITDFPISLDLWLDYTRYLDNTLKVGNIVSNVYSRATKNCPWVGELWIRYMLSLERGHTSEKDLSEVTPRLEELQLFRIHQESKSAEENEKNLKRNAREKRKLGSDITEEPTPSKRLKDIGNTKKAPEENKYQQQNTSQVSKVEGVNWNNPSGQQFNHEKNRAYSDKCTAFISNLHPTANYEHIRNFFSDVGGIVAIRILHDKFTGKSRGLAYVDFLDDEHLAAALAKNKQKLIGKKLSIARSDPRRGGRESSNPKTLTEHADTFNHSGKKSAVSKETDDAYKGDVKDAKFSSRKQENDNIQLRGKNTFAVPRNVRPLGFTANKPIAEDGDEKPKSNEEFRKMFIR
ncbi:hypothetical protein LR48_Vigan08g012900 [Vigna angularis]|uniref:RRM domain-containing protein n=1 Tax=Phaseolus angularis TaxID=3914 RepID=A0A0L9V314_PHAAN|nr:hypothetical protein LR48_Vigan08g012900 [Vigna angularis]